MNKKDIKLLKLDKRTPAEKEAHIDFHKVYGLSPVVWIEKTQSSWNKVSQRNQNTSSSCVDHSIAEAIEAKTGVVVSAHPPYSRRSNAPEEGSVVPEPFQNVQNDGTTTEALDISNGLTEEQMNAPIAVPTPNKIDSFGGIAIDIDQIAQAIDMHKGVILCIDLSWQEWEASPGTPVFLGSGITPDGGHGLSGLDYTMHNGMKCITAQNHWPLPDQLSLNNNSGQLILTEAYLKARCSSAWYVVPPVDMHMQGMNFTLQKFMTFYNDLPAANAAEICFDGVAIALAQEGILSDMTLIGALATVRVEGDPDQPYMCVKENSDGNAYENRADLGNIQTGDGLKYVGRGWIQLTGRANYTKYGQLLGIDLVNNPDLALQPGVSARILAAFFKENCIDVLCNQKEWSDVREKINGGDNGLTEFLSIVNQFLAVI